MHSRKSVEYFLKKYTTQKIWNIAINKKNNLSLFPTIDLIIIIKAKKPRSFECSDKYTGICETADGAFINIVLYTSVSPKFDLFIHQTAYGHASKIAVPQLHLYSVLPNTFTGLFGITNVKIPPPTKSHISSHQ